MSELKSIEEYQLPLSDIATLLHERGFSLNTSFYRLKFYSGHGDSLTIATLISGDTAQVCMVIPYSMSVIDARIDDFTGVPQSHTTMTDERAIYSEIAPLASLSLILFLSHIQRLRAQEWSDYSRLLCLDGNTIQGDILIFKHTTHSFTADCASTPYSEYARQLFHLGLLSFKEVRSLKFLAMMMAFL